MARLASSVKLRLVQMLACFETPSAAVLTIRREFGISIAAQNVEAYDPTKVTGKQLASKWREIFWQTRDTFINEMAGIAISHKAVRLRRLNKIADRATEMGNYLLVAKCLELAAMEMGYTSPRLPP